MKTLKIVLMMILFSLFITSCTDLGIEDEFTKDNIEKLDTRTETDPTCSKKEC